MNHHHQKIEQSYDLGGVIAMIFFTMTPPVLTLVWKRRMIRGGSWITKLVKEQALKRKQRKRKRLGDFLKDDLLRNQIKRQFLQQEIKPTVEQCEQHMIELNRLASEPVTYDDVRITTDHILGEVMWRIQLGLICWYGVAYMIWGREGTEVWYIAEFLISVVIHMLDNKIHLGTFEILSCCGGPRVSDEDEEDDALLHV